MPDRPDEQPWSTEHYGFAESTPEVPPPAPAPAPAPGGDELPHEARPGRDRRLGRARALVVAGVSAGVLAIGGAGVTVGHLAADGGPGVHDRAADGPGGAPRGLPGSGVAGPDLRP